PNILRVSVARVAQ
ncbi:hypothetical protein D046_6945B, partial [Vibrio parahaemolyticus V-223/04]